MMKFTIGKKLYAGFGICVLIMVTLSVFIIREINILGEYQHEGAERAENAVIMEEMVALPSHLYSIFADLIINQDFEDNQKQWQEAIAEMRKDLDAAKEIVDTDQEGEWLEEAEKTALDFIEHYEEARVALKAGDNVTIREIDGVVDKHKVEFAGLIRKISDNIHKEMEEADEVYDSTSKSMIRTSVILALFGAVIGLVLAFIITSMITRPVNQIVKQADAIAKGDLDQNKIEIKSRDEIADLADSFAEMVSALKYKADIVERIADNDLTVQIDLASEKDSLGISLQKMKSSLNEILGLVNSSIEQVASGSNQVSTASQSLSQGASEQASSLEEITSSISEIGSQSKQNADNASQANSLAKQSMQNAEKGNKQMNQLVVAMTDINNSSEEIKKIVKTIDDIAFQINLLALNANVEAARAGKYGKGFAVVAEEVRNLAARSAESVKETTVMVENSTKSIESGNQLVEETSTQLAEIVEGAGKVVDLVEEISTASNEQAQGLDQIGRGLGQIDQVTQSNTASAEESASAAEELASQAQQLKAMVSKFTLDTAAANENGNQSKQMSSEMIKKLIRSEMAGNGGMSHTEVIDNTSSGGSTLEKVRAELAKAKGDAVHTSHPNPKKVIKLDDDDFGKF